MIKIDLNKIDPEKTFVCGCDVTLKDILDVVDQGITDLEIIKRLTHVGMGFCQGRFCIVTAAEIISKRTGKKMEEIALPTARMPIKPVKMKVVSDE
ncbi:(2Fe-2S)-binding protein [Palaeococcus pacificus]|uniref:(2Fe-2S)-binding protein n=1 Tax=Palaeococcus pacificus TaxID=971279 RepID=UPI00064EDB5F|nr:(2Fe-2S)-binding protein [Palaeococcus pacificus]